MSGAMGLLWFHFSGFWIQPNNVDIYEWIIFFVICAKCIHLVLPYQKEKDISYT